MPRIGWSEDHIKRLLELDAEKFSCAVIAVELNNEFRTSFTRNAVIGRLHRMGKPKTKPITTTRQKSAMRSRKSIGQDQSQRNKIMQLFEQAGAEPQAPAPEIADQNIPLKQRRTFQQLQPGECKWPCGDPQEAGFFFCGAPAVPGFPYCASHCLRAFAPRQPRVYSANAFVVEQKEAA